ncbi:response regulator [Sorangium sp. So ce834]|uniref:response regulator n=1 Tax=Sorangium sp. So ce834 TaxID=3133321 RepID=UPI003F60EE97
MDANGPRSGDNDDAPRDPERGDDGVAPGDPSAAPRAPGRGAAEGGPARSRTILVIEDDQGVSDALVGVLSDEGYEVMTARNGAEALARLRDAPAPALIVLDLMMPMLDGYAFRAEQLRVPSIADVPVVVLTAGAAPRAAELGPVDILKKPVNLAALLDAVGRYV